MGKYIVIAVAVVLAMGAYMLFTKNRKKNNDPSLNTGENLIVNGTSPTSISRSENTSAIKLEMLPSLTEIEEASLVEVTDHAVLTRIDQVIPGLAQSGTAAATAIQANGRVLYQAIIPSGTKLTKSRAMKGAFRGFFRGADGIKGHANLVEVNQTTTVVANSAAAAMGIASMVVGQYYMTQINDKLSEINDKIERISNFQNNEYKSNVFALIFQIKKYATYQAEIIDDSEQRTRAINQLDEFENDCIRLLGQANLTLSDYCKKTDLDYETYEKELQEAQNWYIYQQTLLEVLYKISDLKYVLSLGTISREQCREPLQNYSDQVSRVRGQLIDWHEKNVVRLGIDTEEAKRKRAGFDYVLHWLPGLFNDEYNYRPIAEKTVKMIKAQSAISENVHKTINDGLYEHDVRLISKDGKIYYLPEQNPEGSGSFSE